MASGKENCILIKGARANNLKNIYLEIPRGELVVITGVSGSGKSSLAFDTIFAEGQRRFAESLSSFARQFLGRMNKPAADKIEGIPPAIAIEQKVTSRNPRSTVGTVTESYDYLRLLYAKIGKTISPLSGMEVKKESVKDVVVELLKLLSAPAPAERSILYLAAECGLNIPEQRTEVLIGLHEKGYSRLLATEEDRLSLVRLDDLLQHPDDYSGKNILLLVDRFLHQGGEISDELTTRMQDSAKSAFECGEGRLLLITGCGERVIGKREFSNRFEADGMQFEEPTELMFSYNNPIGACPVCKGFGSIEGIDESLVVPNPSLTIYEGAIACWRGDTMGEFKNELILNADRYGIPIHKPYIMLTKEQKSLIWRGTPHFTGIRPFFEMVEKQRYKIQYKYLLSRYSGHTICPACEGNRLKSESEYVKIAGRSISELMNMSVSDLLDFIQKIELDQYSKGIAERALKELTGRLSCICQVGLGYLTLNRSIKTLSGGESQRIHLVSAIGSSLVGSLYILDEPSIGLHPRDTERLIEVLKRLRDLGNTVVIVEHDMEIIRNADYLIDIGPLAGIHGGEVVYAGPVKEAIASKESGRSLTLDYLTGRRFIIPENDGMRKTRKWRDAIELKGCMEHNLKEIDVKIPLGILTVVSGVSGSGKSSLISDILYPAMSRHFNLVGDRPGAFKELKGALSLLSGVEFVDQNPIGKSSRSNPVTYLKIYDDIRKLFSEQPYAKLNNFTPSRFSFNIEGGRCPQCLGEGYVTIPMQFMADVTMVCEECGGKRFKDELLQVKYAGKNINDILSLSVDEAIEFFGSQRESLAKRISERLKILQNVGLGYVQLGQSSCTLSGGESQRIKLAQFLSKENGTGGMLFIFDEPTTGLHLNDIKRLMQSLNALIENGNTVVVVEHNVDVIKSADWVIDMGPEGGDNGGRIIFEGTPANLAKDPNSYTGHALAK